MRRIKTFILDNADDSLLTREESLAIKGILISLVLLGHNKYLMAGGYSFVFLYSFHIYSFYFLPFLYNNHIHKIGDYLVGLFKKFYLPYLICILVIFLISLYNGSGVDYKQLLRGILEGNLYGALSMGSFLWFIPTMICLLICKELYYRCSFVLRTILIIASIGCLLDYAIGISPYSSFHLPFMIRNGLAMLFPGVLCRYVFSNIEKRDIFNVIFLFVVIADFVVIPRQDFYSYKLFTRFIGPIFIFLFLLNLKNVLQEIRLLKNIGGYSFAIYLSHVFIYNIFYLFFDKYYTNSFIIGLSLFGVVFVVSFYISRFFYSVNKR